jgi:hypothetical protein
MSDYYMRSVWCKEQQTYLGELCVIFAVLLHLVRKLSRLLQMSGDLDIYGDKSFAWRNNAFLCS